MVLLTPSCASVKIDDHEMCGDLGQAGASCFHTLTTDSRDIEKDMWDIERFGQICMKPDVFADWKAVIEKLCSIDKRCTYEQKTALINLGLRIDAFERDAFRK